MYDVLNRQCLYYYREDFPEKYARLEKRVRKRDTFQIPPPEYSSLSSTPNYRRVSLEYSPLSPTHMYSPVSPAPEYSPVSPTPEYKPVFSSSTVSPQSSPTFTPLIPLTVQNQILSTQSTPALEASPVTTQSQMSTLSPISAPGFWNQRDQYPLKEEFTTLIEVVESIRVDLLQTSMLIHHIQDFMKKFQY